MLSKVASYIIYKLFITISKQVPFSMFTRIWNEAYQAHVEAEWTKLQKQSLSIKYMQDISGDLVEVRPSELPSNLTLLRLGPNAGLEEKLGTKVTH